MTIETQTSFGKAFADGFKPVDYMSKLFVSVADKVETEDEVFDDELIERVMHKNRVVTIYGDSNCGKTFIALDMAFSIALGREWMGRRVRQGAVLYIATESPASIKKRIKAYKRYHHIEGHLPVYIVEKPLNFFYGSADAQDIIALIHQIEDQTGETVLLTIGDTLAQMSAGANENAGTDMSIVMANAESICRETESAFEWIHHSGKNSANGQRGWSGMRAHISTEIEVKEVEGDSVRQLEIMKQRDGEGKGDVYGFTLQPVVVGTTGFGNPATSCVVLQETPPAKVSPKRESEDARYFKLAVEKTMQETGSNQKDEIRMRFYALKDGNPEAKRQAFFRQWKTYFDNLCAMKAEAEA